MKKEDMKQLSKFFLFGLVVLMLFLSFKVVEPFIITIVSAFILAFFSKPLYDKLHERMNKSHSALVSILLVILIIIIPLAGLVTGVSSQAAELARGLESVPGFVEKINSNELFKTLNIDLAESLRKSTLVIGSTLGSAISYLPKILISFVILIFGLYYLLINWDEIVKNLKHYVPLKNKSKIGKDVSNITTQIVHGFFFIALIEFLIAVAGFYAVGVGPYLIFAVLIFFLGFIPGLGAAIVWIPMAIYYLATSNILAFVGVVVTGLILTFLVEIVLRSKLVGDRANINPFVMLIGTLGGIGMFGVFGFVIGPLILTYALQIVDVLAKEMSKYH